jgi:ketosteroid isomerase-like protein
MKPKEFLISYVEKFNAGDISSLIALYETNACFVSQPGQVVNGLKNIRQALQTFVDMKGKLETKVNGVIHTSDIALVYSEWSFNGSGSDGKPVTIAGNAIDVLRQQSDGSWRILIDDPWGSDLQMSH